MYIKTRILLSMEGILSSPLGRYAKGRILSHATPPSLPGSNQKLPLSLDLLWKRKIFNPYDEKSEQVMHRCSLDRCPLSQHLSLLLPLPPSRENRRKLVQNGRAGREDVGSVFSLHPYARKGGTNVAPWKNDVQSWLGSRLQPTNRLEIISKIFFLFFFLFASIAIRRSGRFVGSIPFGLARACKERVPARLGGERRIRAAEVEGGEAPKARVARRLPLIASLIDPHSPRRRGEADVFRVSTRLYLRSGEGGGEEGGGGDRGREFRRRERESLSILSNFNHPLGNLKIPRKISNLWISLHLPPFYFSLPT